MKRRRAGRICEPHGSEKIDPHQGERPRTGEGFQATPASSELSSPGHPSWTVFAVLWRFVPHFLGHRLAFELSNDHSESAQFESLTPPCAPLGECSRRSSDRGLRNQSARYGTVSRREDELWRVCRYVQRPAPLWDLRKRVRFG